MKNKKLAKLIKKSCIEAYNSVNYSKKKSTLVESSASNDHLYTETDEESKSKIRNLIIRLLKHRDELDYNISDYSISIFTGYEKAVPSNSVSKSNSKIKSSNFHIEITKGVGFSLQCNERRILMKDVTLYEEIKPQIKQIFDEINKNNFKELYSVVMTENGLNRESNLDELLSNF